ncbi:MAG: hypothetical protein AAB408_02365 [Patescibacteria group bacterium]
MPTCCQHEINRAEGVVDDTVRGNDGEHMVCDHDPGRKSGGVGGPVVFLDTGAAATLYGTGSGWYLPPLPNRDRGRRGRAVSASCARPNSAERNPLANERAGTLVRVEETSLATHKRAGVC